MNYFIINVALGIIAMSLRAGMFIKDIKQGEKYCDYMKYEVLLIGIAWPCIIIIILSDAIGWYIKKKGGE